MPFYFSNLILQFANLKVFAPFFISHFTALLVAQLIRSESYFFKGQRSMPCWAF